MGVFRLCGVPKIRQQHAMSCWYAAARMVLGTFVIGPVRGMPGPLAANPTGGGNQSSALFVDGLPNGRYREFQRANNMKSLDTTEEEVMRLARSSGAKLPGFDLQTLVLLLHKYGPLWTVIRLGRHAVVLVGAQQSDGEDHVLYHDPATGQEARMKLEAFRRQVIWDDKGIVAHYELMPGKRPLSGMLSVSDDLFPVGKLPVGD